MWISAEMRWFWPERDFPAAVERWFRDGGLPPGGGATMRADRYFHSQGLRELGVKVRDEAEGRVPDVEVKGLVALLDAPPDLAPGARPELWCKWKAPGFAGAKPIRTEKTRWLRKFDAEPERPREIRLGPDEQPSGGAALPEIGCNLELTRVRVPGAASTWWTLGFESFGGLEAAPAALFKTVRALQPLPQPLGAPLSYPAWLDSLP